MATAKLKKGYAKAGAAATPAAVAAIRKRFEKLVPTWFESEQQLGQTMDDDDEDCIVDDDEPKSIEETLGTPCTASEIAALEKQLGRPLPSSYRAYLSLYGRGAKSFGSPLGPQEHRGKELEDAIKQKSSLFDEFEDTNPFDAGAIPFILDGDSRSMLLFVAPVRGDGDMAIVDYDITEEMERYRTLEAYFKDQIAMARQLVAKHAKDKKKGGIRSQRQAIDAVLAGTKLSDKDARAVALRLSGELPGGSVPCEAVLSDLKSRAEGERLLARLRGMPKLLDQVALPLAAGAATATGNDDKRDKALPFLELLFAGAPKPKKKGDRRKEWWLSILNTAIMATHRAKEYTLAARLADLAAPHIRESTYLHHNAACAYVAVKRFDDALAMCRVAVETGYEYVDRMKTDKDLGPLLRRPDFKALFVR